jgi:hypothetical protein
MARTSAARLRRAGGLVTATSLSAISAAATTLKVDLSSNVRPATHVGEGSLYGVTEKLPADVMGLIAPLHPKMFTNPAADVQQRWGDAIVVAGRVAPTGATVTIRLADWFPGWYSFSNMNDWLDKMSQTVSRKKAAGLTNVYAYEIWNEPNGTWSSNNALSFNEFWRQSYVKLRYLDPGVRITGPSLSFYDERTLKDFLSFCKANDCLPDIVGWHEGTHIASDVQAYRALEKQLGIGPLPITMNEYSGSGRIDDEGRPGASAPLIAQLERSGVDTACITYWDVPHPGRLGTLMATDTDRNGGWWFYEWYGEMTGNMVATTPTVQDGTTLDGVASLDATSATASVVFGGTNDGTVQVVVQGFGAAPLFSVGVHAVVEHTPFVNRSTVVDAPDTISTTDLAISNDQITISIAHTNANDGYRLTLRPVGGGTNGAGGAAGLGGSAGSGGAPATGGVGIAGDAAIASGGAKGGGIPANHSGGAPSGVGGASNPAVDGSGGAPGAGGRALAGDGGAPAGTIGAGGASPGGTSALATSYGDTSHAPSSGGCSCHVGRSRAFPDAMSVLALLSTLTLRRTQRRRGATTDTR